MIAPTDVKYKDSSLFTSIKPEIIASYKIPNAEKPQTDPPERTRCLIVPCIVAGKQKSFTFSELWIGSVSCISDKEK